MKHRWKLDEYGKPDEWAWESGFHNGVYCEDCGETVCVHCDQDWFEWDDCPGPPERKKKTNGDKIRAMTDDELDDFLREVYDTGCKSAESWYCGEGHRHGFEWTEEWLKQPVEE